MSHPVVLYVYSQLSGQPKTTWSRCPKLLLLRWKDKEMLVQLGNSSNVSDPQHTEPTDGQATSLWGTAYQNYEMRLSGNIIGSFQIDYPFIHFIQSDSLWGSSPKLMIINHTKICWWKPNMAILYTLQNWPNAHLPSLCHYFLQSVMPHDPILHADCSIHKHRASCRPPDEREPNYSHIYQDMCLPTPVLQVKAVKAHTVVGHQGFHIIQAIGSQMAVRLSTLHIGHPLPPRNIPGTHFCLKLSRPQGYSALLFSWIN
jgi:hypothetical protein